VFDEIPHSEKVLKRHQNCDDPCIMAWDHYSMNWASYLINEMEKDCREAQDEDYEFHFNWLLILIAFVAWEMPEGVTFLKVEPSKPLAVNFTTLWYTSDMAKQWKSNVVFHAYYLQLKCAIESFP
jgi:hypothetical protein